MHNDELKALSKKIVEILPPNEFVSYVDIANTLDEIPWDVLDALRYLVRTGVVHENVGKLRGTFGHMQKTI